MAHLRIDVGLMNRVIVPAIEEYAQGVLQNPRSLRCERTEAAYALARFRALAKQRLPFAYIREPSPTTLTNAARVARDLDRPIPYEPVPAEAA